MAGGPRPPAAASQGLLRHDRYRNPVRHDYLLFPTRSGQGLVLERCDKRRRGCSSDAHDGAYDVKQKRYGYVRYHGIVALGRLDRHPSHGSGGHRHGDHGNAVTRAFRRSPRPLSAALEILHGAFVLLGGRTGLERAQVAPFAGFWVRLTRVQAIRARFEFPNHGVFS